jgi:hypothetical protein
MRRWARLAAPAVALAALLALAAGGAAAQEAPAAAADAAEGEAGGAALRVTSCTACHGDPEMMGDEEAAELVRRFAADVHAGVELSCHDCHGGDPDPALADDMFAAMDPELADNPFVGVPSRLEIPAFCGRCHSDPAFMKRFHPDARTDQEHEYRTSRHGLLLAAGDEAVATCVDCHGVHRILAPGDPASPVHPVRVADTCGRCHADPAYMAGRTLPGGEPLPVDQVERWRRSVHAAALLDKEDLSAPTCNDCHGNHGAVPPELDSIAFVCGQCHGREATLFRASPKRTGFEEHAELMGDDPAAACSDCHDESEPQAAWSRRHPFGECTSCHGNHAVVRPTLAMLGPLPEIPCAFCHEGAGPVAGGGPGREDVEPAAAVRHYRQVRDGLLAEAAELGLEGDARFDWLVDRAQSLPSHVEGEGEAGEPPPPRPEFGRLFTKLRIGKTRFTYLDPATGEEVSESVVRCTGCHAAEPMLADQPVGYRTSSELLDSLHRMAVAPARAERTLLAARRGGVSVREAEAELDQAVDDQIELQVLVHTFDAGEDGAFAA